VPGGATVTINEGRPAAGHRRPGVVVLFTEAPLRSEGIYPAQPELGVGRNADCAIFLEDEGMSRSHATLCFEARGARLEDHGSRNGTFVNGHRLTQPTEIATGDLIRCGRTLLQLVADVEVYRGWRDRAVDGLLVGGPRVEALRRLIATFAPTDLVVLVSGESGTGKELVARETHTRSGRFGPFLPVNCAALPESLFEAELFGARKGAFTGAVADRQGLFQAAHQGTLFLDEIGELPLPLQAKLLRVVEQHEVIPLGAQQPIFVDARLVVASNRDLAREVEQGNFREDLYHRLAGAVIHIPPLRERIEDIPLLVHHVLGRCGAAGVQASALFMERLLLHGWPGNVRELDRVVREALARSASESASHLTITHLREDFGGISPEADEFEKVRGELTRFHGNVSQAAAALGISRQRLYALLQARGARAEDFR